MKRRPYPLTQGMIIYLQRKNIYPNKIKITHNIQLRIEKQNKEAKIKKIPNRNKNLISTLT